MSFDLAGAYVIGGLSLLALVLVPVVIYVGDVRKTRKQNR